jgi:hypothetical protein
LKPVRLGFRIGLRESCPSIAQKKTLIAAGFFGSWDANSGYVSHRICKEPSTLSPQSFTRVGIRLARYSFSWQCLMRRQRILVGNGATIHIFVILLVRGN